MKSKYLTPPKETRYPLAMSWLNWKRLRSAFLLLVLISNNLYSQPDYIKDYFEKYNIHYAGSMDSRLLYSEEAGLMYKISTYLPPDYKNSNELYPVLVLTDAYYAMNFTRATVDLVTLFGELDKIIIVGIDYFYTDLINFQRNRFKDMTPTYVKGWEPSGEADQFIRFLEDELFPYLENNYQIDTTNRGYYGHSLGGLLGGYILLEYPYLFDKYILISPSYWWNNKEIHKKLAKKYDEGLKPQQDKIVYTGIGANEGDNMIEAWNDFNHTLKNLENFKVYDRVYENESHMGVVPLALSDGIKFMYSEKAKDAEGDPP